MDILQIRLLGDFSIKLRQEPVPGLNKPRLLSLLAYLLLHHEAPQFRYYLANLLWPDSSEAQALTNLRKLVFLINQAFPADCALIRADNQTLQWNDDIPFSLDVAEFQRLLAGGPLADLPLENLEKALNLYHGELLPGCYEDWVIIERERLQQVYITLLDQLIERYENLRLYPAAINCCRQLVSCEPFVKEGYPRLMRLHALNCEIPEALKTYQEYTRLLKRELGIEPDDDTRVLFQQIKAASRQPYPPDMQETFPSALLPLVGRNLEWQAVRALWKSAAAGASRMLLICGEAGIGKSRLAEELTRWAARQGLRTAAAHCYATEGGLPYAPVVEWLRTLSLPALDKVWVTELSRLLPELLNDRTAPPPLTEAWQRMRLFEALARSVLGNRQKSVLLIEDLQWCDPDTLEWLHYLLQFDLHAPLLLVGTVRSEEANDNPAYGRLLSDLRQDGAALELELGPLDESDTAALAAHAAGKPLDNALGSLIYQETEGNPLFIVETVRAEMFKRSRLPGVQTMPYKTRTVLEHRIQQLSIATREMVVLAAAIGRAFSCEVLLQASSASQAELVQLLDELLRHRIVREISPGLFDFSHDKLRQAAFSGVSGAHRQMLHRRVAEALLRLAGNDPQSRSVEIAAQYEQAGDLQSAVKYYRMAADAARSIFANEQAIQLLQRSLALCETLRQVSPGRAISAQEIAQMDEGLGDLLALTGKFPLAQTYFEQVLNLAGSAPGLWRAQVHRKLSAVFVSMYQHPAALAALDQAEQALNLAAGDVPLPDRQEWIQIELARCEFFYWDNHPDQMDAILQKITPLVEAEGRPDQQIELLNQQAMTRMRNERYRLSAATVELLRRRQVLAEAFGGVYNIAWAQFMSGFALLWHGKPLESLPLFHRSLNAAVQMGARLLEVRNLTYLSVASRKLGDLTALRAYNSRLLELAQAIGEHDYHGIGLANQGWLAWREGDAERAVRLCTSAVEIWTAAGGEMFHCLADWVLLAVAVERRDREQAEFWARDLLDPNSMHQSLEEKVAERLNDAFCACQAGEAQAAFRLFDQTLALVKASRDL